MPDLRIDARLDPGTGLYQAEAFHARETGTPLACTEPIYLTITEAVAAVRQLAIEVCGAESIEHATLPPIPDSGQAAASSD